MADIILPDIEISLRDKVSVPPLNIGERGEFLDKCPGISRLLPRASPHAARLG